MHNLLIFEDNDVISDLYELEFTTNATGLHVGIMISKQLIVVISFFEV